MKDVQSQIDEREIAIDKVGVSDVKYPIVVLDRRHEKQHTIANLEMSVELPKQLRGTHMSRFIEVLSQHKGEVTMRTLPAILETLRTKLEAERAHMKVEFPYFLEREAPVSKAKALMEYTSWFEGDLNGDSNDFVLGIRVPVMSLCPCSKEISDYGAHNQRGYLTIETRSFSNKDGSPKIIWLEELIGVAEASASSPVYPVLKRADERYVTMYSYDHPVFVEDMVRNVAVKLKDDSRVAWFKVNAVNHESIHEHSAFAEIEWTHGN